MLASTPHKLPLATVAMVTFNSERYIAEAIESVLCQSHENLELVICDDCSTDNTWKIIQGYSDTRIRAYRNSENIGEYPNRNQAIKLAGGEYLIFIDGDDILYPHGLEFMVRMLDAFPDSAMAMAKPWNEKLIYPVEFTPEQIYNAEYLGRGAIAINFAHVLFKTSVLKECEGFNTKYKAGDVYIQHLIARTHKALLISDGLAWWRRTPGQASERVLNNNYGWLEALMYRTEFLNHELCPLAKPEINAAFSNLHGGFIRMAFRHLLNGRIIYGFGLLFKGKLPLKAWRYTFVPGKYEYMSEISAEQPLSSGMKRNPYSKTSD